MVTILVFSFSACKNDMLEDGVISTNSFNTKENDSIRNEDTSVETETSDKTGETSSSVESDVNEHSHKYTSVIVPATCASQGYTEYKCNCGISYKDNYTSVTYVHNFSRTRKSVAGITYDTTLCTKCGTEAFLYGNADGSIAGGNSRVKYYVTGKVSAANDFLQESDFHIIIYGQGAMPDFASNNYPMWHDYLSEATKITIAEGITTIGSYAFNYPNGRTQITVDMADSVKTIKANSIRLNMKSIVLGKGVERIEDNITGKNMTGIYIPRTLKYFGGLGNSWNINTTIFYEGTKEEFLKITTKRYNQTVTVKTILDSCFSGDVYSPYCHAYLNCTKIFDRTNYFDMMRECQ